MMTTMVVEQAINVTQSGKPADKLELAFRLYDIDRNGSIDQQEMADIIQVLYVRCSQTILHDSIIDCWYSPYCQYAVLE